MERNFSPEQRKFNPENSKNTHEKLKGVLDLISSKVNLEVQEQYRVTKLLNQDGSLRAEGYYGEGGIYPQSLLVQDQKKIHDQEVVNSSAQKTARQEFYRSQHKSEGKNIEDDIIKEWRENKLKSKSTQMEMVITAIFYKFLKNDFIVVRSSAYDDYFSGVDNLLVNKKTGDVLCAFDEVQGEGDGTGPNKKEEKILKIAGKGGANIRHGISIEDGKLKRSKIQNIPVFYLSLKSSELDSLLSDMEYSLETEPTETERTTYTNLIKALEKQKNELQTLPLQEGIKKNLASFERTLLDLKAKINNTSQEKMAA